MVKITLFIPNEDKEKWGCKFCSGMAHFFAFLMLMNNNPNCPKCTASEVVKNGKARGKQRFKWKKCKMQFTRLTPRGCSSEEKTRTIALYNHGLSIRAVARLRGVSAISVLNWIKEFAKKSMKSPLLAMQLSLNSTKCGTFLAQKNKLWIWKAYRRETGELIDWECGARDKATLTKLVERLSKWNVEMFCAATGPVIQNW